MAKPEEPPQPPDSAPTVIRPVEAPTASAVAPGPPGMAAARLAPSTVVGRYVVIDEVGEGGMGVVYVALDPDLNRRVALKILRPDRAGEGTEGRNRFIREAHAMAKLSHPNVVAIYDAGIFGEGVFLAMELVEGTTIGHWLEQAPRSWREILQVFLQAGEGLSAAHAAGLVHRDFKPANVLIGKDGAVKVTDFGVARAAEAAEPRAGGPPVIGSLHDELLETPLTQQGFVTGTPAYMAPEQIHGRPSDARSDEFSFCVALYRALYGDRPFETWEDQQKAAPVKPPPAGTQVPGWLRRILLKGLSRNPEDRYPTLDELLLSLADDPAIRRRKVLEVAAIAVLVVATAGASVFLVLRQRAAADPCHDPGGKLAGVWDDAARQRLRQAFAATGLADAASTGSFAEKAMDRAANRWLAAYQDACQATRVRHEQPEAALQLRLDCLGEQRVAIREASEIMAHPDAGHISSAIGAAITLPLPAECGDARALSLVVQPDPAQRARIDALRLRLARGYALKSVSRTDDAIAVLSPVVEEAHALHAEALEANSLLALGLSYAGRSGPGDLDRAIEYLARAEAEAEDARMDSLATLAAAQRVWDIAVAGHPAAEVDAAVEKMRSDLRHAGTNSPSEYDVENALAVVEYLRGHQGEAVQHARRAMELATRHYGKDHLMTLGAANTLAGVLEPLGKYDEMVDLLRQAIDGSDAILGPGNQGALVERMNLASLLFDLDRLDEADQAVGKLLQQIGSIERVETATSLAIQAAVRAEQGKREESLATARRALEMGARLHMGSNNNDVDLHRYAAEAFLRDGAPDLALAEFNGYLVKQDLPPGNAGWVAFLRLGGWAFLDARQPAKALPILERALALRSAHPFYPGWVPRLRFQIARALVETHGDKKRAAELARTAHDELAALPAEKPLRDEIEAWQARQ